MKASEYIKAMQALIDEHGDLEVKNESYDLQAFNVDEPKVMNMKILTKRESKPKLWRDWHPEKEKGEKVIRV